VLVSAAETMLQQIEELLSAESPALSHLEETLTQGYAEALALDAERLRLERRIGEVAREGRADLGAELSSLGKRLTVTDDELMRLRTVLGTLHDRTRSAREASIG
jgi:hypothetical protein